MRSLIAMLGITLFTAPTVWGQMPNGPGPVPINAGAYFASLDRTTLPVDPAVAPSASARILALQQSPSGYVLLVTASDGAWISCKISADSVDLATGESWIPKGQKVLIALTTQFTPTKSPSSYDASCIPQFLTPAGNIANKSFDSAAVPGILSYSFGPEPDAVTVLATNEDWTPKFSVSEPGTLTLVFDDKLPGLAPTFDTTPGPSPATRILAAPVHTTVLEEGKYYRYHFTGASASGNAVLVQQNKTYLLYKNTTPQLSTAIDLISQPDGIEVKFGLTRQANHLELQFPSGVGLKSKSTPTSGAASWTYDFVIPTDLQTAAAAIGNPTAQGITKSLNDATTTSGGTPTATGTIKLNIVDYDFPNAPTIGQLTLSVVRVSALPLINLLKSQNPKLGLDKTTAQNVANQALGITSTSSPQEKDAASALVTLLMQKGNGNFKNSLVTFLVSAGETVARAYGIPVPPAASLPARPATATGSALASGTPPSN